MVGGVLRRISISISIVLGKKERDDTAVGWGFGGLYRWWDGGKQKREIWKNMGGFWIWVGSVSDLVFGGYFAF